MIDDTALPKKGMLSVGVARQYCGQLGKKANCQSVVSLTLAQGKMPLLVGLRLFLPNERMADAERCARAGVTWRHSARAFHFAGISEAEVMLCFVNKIERYFRSHAIGKRSTPPSS